MDAHLIHRDDHTQNTDGETGNEPANDEHGDVDRRSLECAS
jgi:hypothetical protein